MGLGAAYGGGGGEPSFTITSEIPTGEIWTSGKPIYRKGYSGTCDATSPMIDIDTTSLGIDEPVRWFGRIKRALISTEDQFVALDASHPTDLDQNLLVAFRKSNFRVVEGSTETQFDGFPYVLFLYYTKA